MLPANPSSRPRVPLLLCALCVSAGHFHAAAQTTDPYEQYLKTSADFRPVPQDRDMLLKPWPRFVYMPWTAKWTIGYTPESGKWSLDHGYNGAFVDREPSRDKLAWIDRFEMPFYVDHAAGKGDLHLFDGGAIKANLNDLHGTGVRTKPVNAAMAAKLRALLRHNIEAAKASRFRAAYALDDELSWGHFVHPTMWQVTDDKAAYPKWLDEIYGEGNAPKRDKWVSYNDVWPKLKAWSIGEFDASPLLDQWTFNDAYWLNFIGDLVEYANSIDPQTPAGFVGGQAPNAFGGYDYARLMRKVQFIESYNIGSSQAVIRSFNPGNAIPAVTTHFHRGTADTVWQAWYYLAHGNKGFIGWVDKWFDGVTPRPFHDEIAPTLLEVEQLSPILHGATWVHDGVAIYYSHPSIQIGWVLDAECQHKTWIARNNDHRLGAGHHVRHAWENMLRDSGLQYNFINYVDTVQKGVPKEYSTLILPACLALSDAEARRIREWVRGGGTLIADYLPGVFDQHGKGRPAGGALDDVFGVKQDPSLRQRDVFGGRDLWTEVDQDANYGWKTYEGFLTNKNSCLQDPSGFNTAVRNAPTARVNAFGQGKAVLMNLSPQWYNAYRTGGPEAARKRETFTKHIPAKPRVRLKGADERTFGHEIAYWQKDGRTFCFLTFNPEVEGTELGGGNSTGLKSDTVPVTLEFSNEVKNVKDERTRKPLPNGRVFQFDWKMNEAVVLSLSAN
jgi:hypothetical protein